jgi:hypothetical protein
MTWSATSPSPPPGSGALPPNPNTWWTNTATDPVIALNCGGGNVSLIFYQYIFTTPPAWQTCTFTGTVTSWSPFSVTFSVVPSGCPAAMGEICGAGTPNFTVTVTS